MSTWSLLARQSSLVMGGGLVVVAIAGCSATSPFRLGAEKPSQAKTTLAVGDKPLPTVTGEPGSSIVARTEKPVSPSSRVGTAESRISGRVIDENGQPVPNARVRLAVSGAIGGKVVAATTDRSGGFTLRGLRPGSTYTVIAEWQGNDGHLVGRAQARPADTDVRISLAPEGVEEPAGGNRVRGVSDRIEGDDRDAFPAPHNGDSPRQPALNVNEEDLPPATEAEALAPRPNNNDGQATSRAATSNRRTDPDPANRRRGEWERPATGTTATPPPSADREPARPADEPLGAPLDPETRNVSAPPIDPDDDGPNPLPPAIEPARKPVAPAEPEGEAVPPMGSNLAPASVPDPLAQQAPLPFDPAPLADGRRPLDTRLADPFEPFESPTRPTEPPSLKADQKAPPLFSPVVLDPQPQPTRQAVVSNPPRAEMPIMPSRPEPAPVAVAVQDAAKRRPTWGEVAAVNPAPASVERTSVSRSAPARPAPRVDDGKVFCDYDDRHRRLNDFLLPDLEGRPVHFKDIDADLVLIDFWGTWCGPCIGSIPHLTELQEKMKGRRLVVLGIACEQDDPKDSAAKVAAAARKLNVNYPVLLSRNDGSCPVQRAFAVQAFPTMILVDREGRIVWRDQGATPATLARLDRVLSEPAAEMARRN